MSLFFLNIRNTFLHIAGLENVNQCNFNSNHLLRFSFYFSIIFYVSCSIIVKAHLCVQRWHVIFKFFSHVIEDLAPQANFADKG